MCLQRNLYVILLRSLPSTRPKKKNMYTKYGEIFFEYVLILNQSSLHIKEVVVYFLTHPVHYCEVEALEVTKQQVSSFYLTIS